MWGVHPCAAVMASGSRSIVRVIQDSSGSQSSAAAPIFSCATSRGIPLQRVDRITFARMFGDTTAQGIGMIVEHASPVCVDDPVALSAAAFRQACQPPLLLALDGLTDPHNIGAILRTALLMNVSAVIVCDRNSAPLNGTVSKTSSGALEWLLASGRLLVTRHLASLLGSLAENRSEQWKIIGCSTANTASVRPPKEQSPNTSRAYLAAAHIDFGALERSSPTILVLGNEGRGIRQSILQACTHTVCAPMHCTNNSCAPKHNKFAESTDSAALFKLGALDSYNVSVAAAVLLAKLQLKELSEPM